MSTDTSLIQRVRHFFVSLFDKKQTKLYLSDNQFNNLADSIKDYFIQHQRGAYFITNLAGEEKLLANLVVEKLNSNSNGFLAIPISVRLGGKGEHIALKFMEAIHKDINKYEDVKKELGRKFWDDLNKCLKEASQVERFVDEATIKKLKQWIQESTKTNEKGVNVNLAFKPLPQVELGAEGKIEDINEVSKRFVISEEESSRNIHEVEIKKWDEIKLLNELNDFIDITEGIKILFHYDWLERVKKELNDPELKRLQKWYNDVKKTFGCFGCFFAPIIWLFDIGIWIAEFSLLLVKPVYFLLRFALKRTRLFNISGLRNVKLFFIVEGVEGDGFLNDISISILRSVFRNLNAMFLVFSDEKVFNRFFNK